MAVKLEETFFLNIYNEPEAATQLCPEIRCNNEENILVFTGI